jgi:NAD(P)H-dependent FMN reductase
VDAKLNLPVLLGTNRKLRNSVWPARWLVGEMQKRPEIQTRLFDVAEFALPQDDYGQEIKDRFPEWREAIIQADGLVIVTPEYNHGYPGALKAVLDLLLKEYIHKAVAFVGVSAGPWGGTRVIESMSWVSRLRLRISISRKYRQFLTPRENCSTPRSYNEPLRFSMSWYG